MKRISDKGIKELNRLVGHDVWKIIEYYHINMWMIITEKKRIKNDIQKHEKIINLMNVGISVCDGFIEMLEIYDGNDFLKMMRYNRFNYCHFLGLINHYKKVKKKNIDSKMELIVIYNNINKHGLFPSDD